MSAFRLLLPVLFPCSIGLVIRQIHHRCAPNRSEVLPRTRFDLADAQFGSTCCVSPAQRRTSERRITGVLETELKYLSNPNTVTEADLDIGSRFICQEGQRCARRYSEKLNSIWPLYTTCSWAISGTSIGYLLFQPHIGGVNTPPNNSGTRAIPAHSAR